MSLKKQDIYSQFKNNQKYKKKLINFLRENTTVETGGTQIFDGSFKHLLHIPEELADIIFYLKNNEAKKKRKIKKYLEIGFSHGIANTILNKFFNFKEIVAVDKFGAHINGQTLLPNLRFKNLTLICSDSRDKETINKVDKFKKFDVILIDGDHAYDSVKKDFNNYKSFIDKKGLIIMHDINLENSGSKKFWMELKKSKKYYFKEIICANYKFNYGVGILQPR